MARAGEAATAAPRDWSGGLTDGTVSSAAGGARHVGEARLASPKADGASGAPLASPRASALASLAIAADGGDSTARHASPRGTATPKLAGGSPADDAIEDIGLGWFQAMAVVVCGIGNASDAVELLCISFVLPVIDPSSTVTDVEKGALSAAVFVGMLFGGLFAGFLSDVLGRKPLLVGSLVVNAAFGLLSAFMPNWQLLAACRVVAGVGVGGSIPGVFTLFVEYLPVHRRGFLLSLVAFFWMVGTIYTAGAAWIIIGIADFSWRWFVAACAIPAATAAILTVLLLPESPRFLYVQGQSAACEASLRYMARWNRRPPPPALLDLAEAPPAGSARSKAAGVSDATPLTAAATPPGRTRSSGGTAPVPAIRRTWRSRCRELGVATREQVMEMFSPSLRRTSLLLLVTWASLSFGWYGLSIWTPTIFKAANISLSLYQDSFLVAAANLPGNIVATLLMDVVGRKRLMASSLLASCLCTVFFAVARGEAAVVAAACLLNAVSVGCWNALDCLSTESFPTRLRTSSMGVLAASGRIGSIVGQFVFGAMLSVSVPALLGTAAGVLLIGAAAGFALPAEPAGRHLADFVDDAGGDVAAAAAARGRGNSSGGGGITASAAVSGTGGAGHELVHVEAGARDLVGRSSGHTPHAAGGRSAAERDTTSLLTADDRS